MCLAQYYRNSTELMPTTGLTRIHTTDHTRISKTATVTYVADLAIVTGAEQFSCFVWGLGGIL